MKKGLIGFCLLLLAGYSFAQTPAPTALTPAPPAPSPAAPKSSSASSSSDETAIRQVLADQVAAWNRGNIDDFMKGYWNNDSLIFIGKSGPTYGYRQALEHYKKTYSSRDQMGTLFFTLLSIKKLSPDYCFVIGKWLLKRKPGDIGGVYTLLFRKIGGRWLIVTDHTS